MNTLRRLLCFLSNFGWLAIIFLIGGAVLAINALNMVGFGLKVVPVSIRSDFGAQDMVFAGVGLWISAMCLRAGVVFWTWPADK